ncbi:hypothetical protein BSP239C_01255 [Brevibacterium sp. 239c]|nr:hypothetical protein [Brevibacterium sp. 239c]SMX79478.1 hypothetical protein BSP239C_01255 [Brevibacterium sp. 239c]
MTQTDSDKVTSLPDLISMDYAEEAIDFEQVRLNFQVRSIQF